MDFTHIKTNAPKNTKVIDTFTNPTLTDRDKYKALQEENDNLLEYTQYWGITDIELDKSIDRMMQINYELSQLNLD